MDFIDFLITPQHLPGTVILFIGLILGLVTTAVDLFRPKLSDVPDHLLGKRFMQNIFFIILGVFAIICILIGGGILLTT